MEVTLRKTNSSSGSLLHELKNVPDCIHCGARGFEKCVRLHSLWCNTSFSKIDESAICKKCNEEVLETSPRYRITINVIQGDCNARITLFGQVAEVYVGCSVDEYLSSIKEGETESTYYRRLSTQAYTEMRFMTMLKSIKFDQRGNLNIVANAIEKMEPMESIDVGDIEEEPTEMEEKKHSPEKSKKKIPSRKKKSTMELQPVR
ncbi:uncharacterized protein LOC130994384 [Salvia miltiorrhiza]|uniref:uncharacterized protein LOC130994384 n=1 Tax=Salvia miltiorrhiza TaxID=226208 RepID=UPI0025AD066C|nr:uncharacterized protein LOC130994384 [Salvia miltiorrhiza]